MTAHQNQRRKNWIYVSLWVTCIYSTLYIVRPACDFFKATTPFTFLTDLFIILLLGLIILFFWKKKQLKRPASYFLLAVAILLYGYGLTKIQYPEEKLHFMEYGFLAYLIYKAFLIDFRKRQAFLFAFLLTSVLGWIDEGIQYHLPNRYYQNSDVLLNSLSGALGLFLTFIFQRDVGQTSDK